MKYIKLAVIAVLGTSALTSCFKAEPLNAECDITRAYISIDNPDDMFDKRNDSTIQVSSLDSVIMFEVKADADLTAVPVFFDLTPGATISPANGSVQRFCKDNPDSLQDVHYVVTSEDRAYSRTYTVKFTRHAVPSDTIRFDFETYEKNTNKPAGKYYVWMDINNDGTKEYRWATGNAGFYLSQTMAKATAYPSVPIEGELSANCVQLITRSTGKLAEGYKMPIAAGNLFYGRFVSESAFLDPMSATQFGWAINYKPIRFCGYYKYQRGETMIDRNKNTLPDRQDYGAIYAVLYDNHEGTVMLNGNNVLTSEDIVALAKMPDIDNTQGWVHFDLKFDYLQPFDKAKMKATGYSLAIVCSSSKDGDRFEGAIGSTLLVDEFSIIREKTEQEQNNAEQ